MTPEKVVSPDYLERLAFRTGTEISMGGGEASLTHDGVKYLCKIPAQREPGDES